MISNGNENGMVMPVAPYDSVSKTVSVPVWNGCCQTVTLRNISTIPILVQNPVINFSRPDLAVTY